MIYFEPEQQENETIVGNFVEISLRTLMIAFSSSLAQGTVSIISKSGFPAKIPLILGL